MVRCRYHLVSTLGLYENTLEYTELLNGLIFDRVYGSWTLSSLLCTLGSSYKVRLRVLQILVEIDSNFREF